ncbi:MAG: hypothetical protein QNJ94_06160 [Alphaproteobacteria bacterium]|nr:hypothetical protein [Alphaproteobacteria bacterium]
MTFALIVDGVVIVLLCVAIYFGVVLSRRLAALRRNEAEMRAKLDEFSAAAAQTEAALSRVKGLGSGEPVVGADPDVLAKGEVLRDDLMYLIERAEAVTRKSQLAGRPAPVAAPVGTSENDIGHALRQAVRGRSGEAGS